jgi:hypothetical protein
VGLRLLEGSYSLLSGMGAVETVGIGVDAPGPPPLYLGQAVRDYIFQVHSFSATRRR